MDLMTPASPAHSGVARRPRTAADWCGLLFLALVVVVVGAVVFLLGPLLAIACSSCEDGVRGPLGFAEVLFAVRDFVVPLTVLGTVPAVFHRRGGARAGGVGLGVLALCFVVMMVAGRITA